MPKPRRPRPSFNFRPLRLAALGLAVLVFGIGIGVIGNKVFRGDGKSAPPAENERAAPSSNTSEGRKSSSTRIAPTPPLAPGVALADRPAEGPLPAWQRFAAAAPAADARPWIAVVIDDLGLDRKRAFRTVELPGPLTLALMTYAEDLPGLAAKAQARGHELMLHVPMEPQDKGENPGPQALLVGQDAAEIQRRLRWGLDRFEGFVGINNHMGSKFTAAEPAMRLVLAEVKARGLLFLDSRTSSQTVGARLAGAMGVPHVSRDLFLDVDDRPEAIRGQLDQAEKLARKQGHAVVIGHPHDNTIAALEAWIPKLNGRGIALAPISAIVRRQLAG